MDPKLTEIAQTFERFKAASVRNDFDTSTRLLSQLKVSLTEFRSLPPLFEATPNAVHELSLARDIYEHAVVLSVKMEDQEAFERDFCQLKPYYTDARGHIPQSPQEYPILGLNLLRLLVQNRIAEFHTELELLSSTALDNPCIKHAVELEQSFMEGAYNRVLSARQSVPHETYVHFMDLLAKTVRDEIAGCSEKAYDSLSLNDAKQLLLFSSDKDLLEYINEEHPDWVRVFLQILSPQFLEDLPSFSVFLFQIEGRSMAPSLPQFYRGTSTLALVARASAFTAGLVYGNMKLKVLKMKAKSHKKAEAKTGAQAEAHH